MWFRCFNPFKIFLLFLIISFGKYNLLFFCNYLSFSFSANLILLFFSFKSKFRLFVFEEEKLNLQSHFIVFFCLTFNANLVPILSRWITFKGLKFILLGVKNNRETDLNLESIVPNFVFLCFPILDAKLSPYVIW